jgi:hypothetical protein
MPVPTSRERLSSLAYGLIVVGPIVLLLITGGKILEPFSIAALFPIALAAAVDPGWNAALKGL